MKWLCFLLVVLVLAGNVSAYTFVDIYLDDSGSALFLGGTDESVTFPKGVEVNDGEIIGKTQELTGKIGEIWSFSYSLEGAEINLILPKGTRIISIDRGEIFIENDKIYINSLEEINLTYVIEDQSSNLALWVSTIVLVLIVFGFLFYYKVKLRKKILERKKLVRGILRKRENLILDRLGQTGKIKSSQLRKVCDIPKASFSRHVQELERKKLLKKTGEGKNKFLELI